MLAGKRAWMFLVVVLALAVGSPLLASGGHGIDGKSIALWLTIPFVGILLSIAVCPLLMPHFWHHHYGKVAIFWAILAIIGLLVAQPGGAGVGDIFYDMTHVMLLDYVPFIILLLGLFTIAGGIRVKGTLRGSPMLNAIMLLIGTVLASLMGTTGAAMLMIRPVLRANAWRKNKVHVVVFFIFLVCNIGGSLTPLGDPPLFLGFLRGVEFTWTFKLLPETALLTGLLLAIFFAVDTLLMKREDKQTPPAEPGDHGEKFGIEGGINFVLLGLLIGAILLSSHLGSSSKGDMGKGMYYDQDVHARYDAAIKKADTRARLFKEALVAVDKDQKTAALKYGEAVALTNELKDVHLSPHPAHGEEGHDHAHHHEHDDHGMPASNPENFVIAESKLNAAQKAWAGDLNVRLAALKAGGVKAEDMKPLLLLDFNHAVIETNGLRQTQGNEATKALAIADGVPKIPYANIVRDLIILVLVFISLKVTTKECRTKNSFSWAPILEVAKLFAGIFICIVPALKILAAGVDGQLAGVVGAVTTPNGDAINSSYFWFSGMLSSFLDNAPTYLVFFNTAGGDAQYLMNEGHATLLAISMGAVFMGANTYIGNAPNFMVKAIAEEDNIKMPSFFGYMLWSLLLLIPLFVLVTFIAF